VKKNTAQERANGLYVSLRYLQEEAIKSNFNDLAKLIETAAVAAREIWMRVYTDSKLAPRRRSRREERL